MRYFQDAEKAFEQLNEQHKNEMELLDSVGPSYFHTSQLLRMQGQLEVKFEWMLRLQRISMVLAALSPIWLLISFIAALFHDESFSRFAMAMFPITLTFFLVTIGLIAKYFKGKGHLEKMESTIREELKRRQKEDTDQYDIWKAGLN